MHNEMLPLDHIMSNHHQLGLLIAAPHDCEIAMHNDLAAMYNMLSMRGLSPEEILSLEGKIGRGLLMTFLQEVRKEVIKWSSGEVFFYYTGHGIYSVEGSLARAGMWLNSAHDASNYLFWDEVFSILDLPAKIRLLVLPDS